MIRRVAAGVVAGLALLLSACGGLQGTVVYKDYSPSRTDVHSGMRTYYRSVTTTIPATCYSTTNGKTTSYACTKRDTKQVPFKKFETWTTYTPECWRIVVKVDGDDRTHDRCVRHEVWGQLEVDSHYDSETYK